MQKNDVIKKLSNRELNLKTNNLIVTNVDSFSIINHIPDVCNISFYENDIDVSQAINIKVDFLETNIHEILTYILKYLENIDLLDNTLDCDISFNNKFDLLKFQFILRNYNIVVQLLCINIESLSKEDQMLFNELYYFNNPFFNITSFIKDDNFKTYFLTQNRVLDDRENYERIVLDKSYNLNNEKNKDLKKLAPEKNLFPVEDNKELTYQDWINLEKEISLKIEENRNRLLRSNINNKNKSFVDDNSDLKLLFEDGITMISYKKVDENNNYMDYTLSISDDFIFNAYSDDYEQDELIFVINEDNPLYLPFYNLIGKDNFIKLTSDYKREELDNLYYIEILKENNSIILKFVNNIKEEHNSIDKFNFVIINVMYDLRSKLDQRKTDYKKRLSIFFEEAINNIKENTDEVKKLKKL